MNNKMPVKILSQSCSDFGLPDIQCLFNTLPSIVFIGGHALPGRVSSHYNPSPPAYGHPGIHIQQVDPQVMIHPRANIRIVPAHFSNKVSSVYLGTNRGVKPAINIPGESLGWLLNSIPQVFCRAFERPTAIPTLAALLNGPHQTSRVGPGATGHHRRKKIFSRA